MVEDGEEATHLFVINLYVYVHLILYYIIYSRYIQLNAYAHIAFQVVVVCVYFHFGKGGLPFNPSIRPQNCVRIQAAKLEETQGNEKMARGSDGKCDRRWPTRSDSQPFHKELQQTIPLTGP